MLSWFGIKSQNNEESANKESNNDVNVDDESSEKTAEASRGDGEEASVEESTGPKPGPNKPNNAKSASMEAVGAAVGFFRNFATAAGKTAHKLKESVDEKLDKTIIGELERENERFVREKHSKRTEDPVPPWVGYNEEEEIKTQILSLSSDERHFLRDPPSGVEFHFDLDAVMPIALTILEEDKQLQAMRFKLVPKKIKEEKFWRNYFYRVSLIKQSSQLSTLANSELKRSSSSLNQDSKRNSKSDLEKAISDASNDDTTKNQNQSKPEDRLRATEQDANDKSKTERSSSTKQDAETDDWEKELQDELQDFEFVSEDQGGEHENNPEWEKEIENMLGLDEEDDSESKTN